MEAFTAGRTSSKIRFVNSRGPLPASSRLDIHPFPHDIQICLSTCEARRIMHYFGLVLLLSLTSGCVSPRLDGHPALFATVPEPIVPLPTVTPFGGKPEARRAYLEGYYLGYLAGLAGNQSLHYDYRSPSLITVAHDMGCTTGSNDGYTARRKQQHKLLMDQTQR